MRSLNTWRIVVAAGLAVVGAVAVAVGGAGHGQPAEDSVGSAPPGSLAHDRGVWQELLGDHAKIRRAVRFTEKGVEAETESDDPAVSAKIIEHATAMQERIKNGQRVRVWDPVFKELFEKHEAVTIQVEPTTRGVKIVESSEDPAVVALLRSHALGVSEFVRHGFASAPRRTARVEASDPLPPPELAIGGVPHRFLLAPPDAEQLALLKRQGVGMIVNFRKDSETPGYDERSAAAGAGLEYCNLPYQGAPELTDAVLDEARRTIAAASKGPVVLALHCRTGNRVGPAWASYRAIDAGIAVEQAIAEARAMQMADPLTESLTRDYIRRHAAGADASGGWKSVAASELPEEFKARHKQAVEARDAMFRRVLSELMAGMAGEAKDGPGSAVRVCAEKAPQIARAVAKEKGLMIGRTSFRLRNRMNAAPPWASAALAEKPADPRLFVNDDGSLGVTLPIKLVGMCLGCHGDPASMDPAIKAVLVEKYPDDQATGFREGDLRGWFWVEVPPK